MSDAKLSSNKTSNKSLSENKCLKADGSLSQNKSLKNNKIVASWLRFSENHPGVSQFLVFFILSNGITILQMVLMPMLKGVFEAYTFSKYKFSSSAGWS